MTDMRNPVQSALQSCAQGNEQALQRLYQLEAPRMMSLALHMVGQRAIAEDLLTDTFVLIWKNAESYEPERASARAWLYSILRYRAISRLRQVGRPAGSQTGFASFPSSETLAAAANGSLRPVFLQGLAALDDTVRLGIFLAFYKGYDYPRIAHRIERSVSQCRQMVTHGLQALLEARDADEKQAVLLAEYTLGLLAPDEVKSVHALLAHDDAAVLQALSWEDRFLGLTDLLTVVHPSGQVYYRIQARLGHDAIPSPGTLLRQPEQPVSSEDVQAGIVTAQPPNDMPLPEIPADLAPGLPAPAIATEQVNTRDTPENISAIPARVTQADGLFQHAGLADDASPSQHSVTAQPRYRSDAPASRSNGVWKWLAVFFALVAAAAVASHAFRPPPEPPVTVIKVAPQMGAILQPPSASSTPGWVVSMDHQQNLMFRPLVQTEIPSDTQVMLWTRATTTEPSRLLASIDPNKPFTLAASQSGLIKDGQIFEMTQESLQVDASAGPQGPVLYIGRMVTFGQQPSLEPRAGQGTTH
jgi:RNA polymerase sigma factor (sigma-70 family)